MLKNAYYNQAATKAKIADLSHKIERLEERYILEEITGELYQKYKLKFETEREGIEVEIKKNKIEMSKLDDYINFTLNLSINLRKMWASSDYTQRQELQNTFYPQGITYNRQKDECRSIEVNEFLEEASDLSRTFATFTPEQIKNLDFSSLSAHRAKSRSKNKNINGKRNRDASNNNRKFSTSDKNDFWTDSIGEEI